MDIRVSFSGRAAGLAVAVIIGSFSSATAQLQVQPVTGTPAQQALALAQHLAGSGVQVTNATLSAGINAQPSAGMFIDSASSIGISSGVILTSGLLSAVPGPNTVGSGGGPGTGLVGDPQLAALVQNGQAVNDVCALEFDLTPVNDSLTFRYVFGSEEYNEFVCSNFNDVFGFFISGPGIVSNINQSNVRNLPLIPGLQSFVSINTVNNGSCGPSGTFGPGMNLGNSQYFVDNTGGQIVEYDGLTVVLTVGVGVIPGQTYHLKLAIADVSDFSFDSGVFIEAGSIVSPIRLASAGQLADKVATSVYPNPVNGQEAQLFIGEAEAAQGNLQVIVTDALGRQVFSLEASARQTASSLKLPTEALSPGLYLYQVLQAGEVVSRGKFSVE